MSNIIAIIIQEDYDLIIKILKNSTNTSIGIAKGNFWAKNNFYLYDLKTFQNSILQLMEVKNANSNDKPGWVICLFQNLYTVLEKIHSNIHKHSGSKKTFDAGMIKNSNKTPKNVLFVWMEDNNRKDWSIGLSIVTYLLEGIIEDEEVSENENNDFSNEYKDFNKINQVNNIEKSSAS
ncbi:45446_t:CDS:2 [Gigaspora margarita]|uniref:45446_t:CDS:1 n=1 Tax=Gigaspora margarita TaxID=4874 RepID=A0ABN7V3N0_GIGMA|nr:45446_t:CDS:2 [Gigaspora margarita]